ncbi:hypothetical protein B296_00018528 [Ensete ventricosum]|uniref:Uncharacterized protein n=1 Tax=Ensete ventricosum TaxID=4639 RepID=A0A426Z5Z1_ENSVE|nr:hypothetical protein B296_00018528 [Ensete ventricosum]
MRIQQLELIGGSSRSRIPATQLSGRSPSPVRQLALSSPAALELPAPMEGPNPSRRRRSRGSDLDGGGLIGAAAVEGEGFGGEEEGDAGSLSGRRQIQEEEETKPTIHSNSRELAGFPVWLLDAAARMLGEVSSTEWRAIDGERTQLADTCRRLHLMPVSSPGTCTGKNEHGEKTQMLMYRTSLGNVEKQKA